MILKIFVITISILFVGGVIAYSTYKRKTGKGGCCGNCSKCSCCSQPKTNQENTQK